jgi:preprotein translocase subunit Sss1
MRRQLPDGPDHGVEPTGAQGGARPCASTSGSRRATWRAPCRAGDRCTAHDAPRRLRAMSRFTRTVVRLLRHPTLTLASNAAFLIGAGIFAAGLVGGALKVLTSFPTIWLALSAGGAFLLVTGGLGMLVRAKVAPPVSSDPSPSSDPGERQLAIGRVLTELESARGAIERADDEDEWWMEPLSTDAWQRSADALAGAGLVEAHKTTRVAYRHIDDLNARAAETMEAMQGHYMYDVPPGRRPVTGGSDAIHEALDRAVAAIKTAEAELEKAQGDVAGG